MALGIAFEGCACRGAFLVGAVERLLEEGLPVTAASGASSGSIVATGVALGRVGSLRERWRALLGRTRLFQPGLLLRGRWPLVMSDVLAAALEAELGDTRLPQVPLPLAIVVTQLGLRGRVRRVLTQADDVPLRTAIAASSFLPGPYGRMVPIDGRLTVDGAWQVRVPVDEPRALGATHVIACVSEPAGRLRRGLFRERVAPPPPWARVLFPAAPLALGSFDFDPGRTEAAFAAGRVAAEGFLRAHAAWLAEAVAAAPAPGRSGAGALGRAQ